MRLFDNYQTDGFFDEMFLPDGRPRPHYAAVHRILNKLTPAEFEAKFAMAERAMVAQGITFTVYGDEQGVEKPFPVDLIPRIVPADEWAHIEKGLQQRVRALNLFVHDIYNDETILKDRVIPRDLVVNAAHYRREMVGARVAGDLYVHICGTDLIRDIDGTYRVLEDNCR